MSRPPVMDGLFKGIQNETGMGRPADAPPDDPTGIDVDNEGHIHKSCPGRDIGEVRNPQPVRSGRMELPVHLVERARRGLVADRRLAPACPG